MLFTEPLVGWLALYASFTYSLIYLTLEVFPIVFYEKRGWSLIVSSLPFLGIFLGVLCAAFVNFANQPRYRRAVRENNGEAVPEARLPPLVVGGVLLSAGLFWFGWTAPPRYPWPLPVVASGEGLPRVKCHPVHRSFFTHNQCSPFRLDCCWFQHRFPTMPQFLGRHVWPIRC